MIEQLDKDWYQSENLLFKDDGKIDSPKSKTRVWLVLSRTNNTELGQVKWFAVWHKYCFFPAVSTVFDGKCMTAIVEFCKDRTNDQRSKWKKRVPEPKYEKLLVPRAIVTNRS